MKKQDFDYTLPEHNIAQTPLEQRSASRMLHISRQDGRTTDGYISDLPNYLTADDLIVFNDTKVIPARLFGQKPTGGQVEVFLERILDTQHISAKVRANKALKLGNEVYIGDYQLTCQAREGELFSFALKHGDVADLLKTHGHIPLPPYIRREDTENDRTRYQTIWAKYDGAVAAPTAGLHFDETLLAKISATGISEGYVTLHVGSGTYQRLRDGEVSTQRLHSERIEVNEQLCQQVRDTHARGGRVIAVGTTVVRSLETAAHGGEIQPYEGETELFLKPGDRFNVVDAIVTNFHEPQSSLIMLACAFAGKKHILNAYQYAVNAGYRFLSYGDATFLS